MSPVSVMVIRQVPTAEPTSILSNDETSNMRQTRDGGGHFELTETAVHQSGLQGQQADWIVSMHIKQSAEEITLAAGRDSRAKRDIVPSKAPCTASFDP